MLIARLRVPACSRAGRARQLTARVAAAAATVARMDRSAAGEYHDSDFKWEDIVEEAQEALARQAAGAEHRASCSTSKHPPLPYQNWEAFHATHSSAQFFKERRYMPLAFPEVMQVDPLLHIVELGCGCGASIVPILKANPSCTATVCDVSETAINSLCDIVESAGITPERVHAFAHDATAPTVQLEGSQADACLLVFTLSAVQPDDMAAMLALAHGVLKPGGRLLIRDYGLYDMPSLRFPAEQKLGENLYRRLDGTLAYFFPKEDLVRRCSAAGLQEEYCKYVCVTNKNRKTGQELRRVFVQGSFCKEAVT